ncbi:hypothetical protein [Photorhabdus heterorhabditis]|uniref:hypothetical protein n=1 Tax=Photorhabdus heterorhabditis TaxID=880156 RepID=UPI001BD1FE63|nr:hypothetical protein [Photorhabdus heterorhabditis]MBS9440340.1 hypothetical protein [Photorhabdus heterorhabditis]
MKLKLLLLLLGVLIMSGANADEPRLYIRSLFDIQYAFCDIKTNGVTGFSNRNSALEGRGFGTASTGSMLFMENGENEISLEFGALGWFSPDEMSDKARNHFNPEATCRLELTAMRGKDSEVLTAIEVAINKNGQPVATPPVNETKYAAISTPVARHMIQADNVEAGHIDKNYFDIQKFPPNMTLYRFSRSVKISSLPDWKWVKATPYTDTPEQRQQLQQAYMAVWQAYHIKDVNAIREQQKVSLKAWAWATGESEENIFTSKFFHHDFKEKSFRMRTINWNDYRVKIMNQGRMVRLVNKSDLRNSPISYYVNDEDGDTDLVTIAPIFSLINGRFVQVI